MAWQPILNSKEAKKGIWKPVLKVSEAKNRSQFGNVRPRNPLFDRTLEDAAESALFKTGTPSTPRTTDFGTGDLAKALGQTTMQGFGSIGAALKGLPEQARALASDTPVRPGSQSFTPTGAFQKGLYGTDKPISLETGGEIPGFIEKGQAFKPFGVEIPGISNPMAVGAAFGILDLAGAGGIRGLKGLSTALKSTKEVGEALTLLKQAGFSDDIAQQYAPLFAKEKNAKKIEEGLLSAEKLQNSTKATNVDTDPLIAEARKYKSAEEFVRELKKKPYSEIGRQYQQALKTGDNYEFHLSTEPNLKEGKSFAEQVRTNSRDAQSGQAGGSIYTSKNPDFWMGEIAQKGTANPNQLYLVKVKDYEPSGRLLESGGESQSFNAPKDVVVVKKMPTTKDGTPDFGLAQELREKTILTDLWNKAQGTKATQAFEGFDDLSTKLLEKLKGRTTVSRQFIEDLTNSPDLKQAERDLIRRTLADEADTVSVPNFADRVKSELLPLKVQDSDIYKGTSKAFYDGSEMISEGNFTPKYENITLPPELRGRVQSYRENIYESPISTSAGDVHFNYQTKNYFAHSRIEDLPEKTGTRRVIELQSDLMQKGRIEQELESAKIAIYKKINKQHSDELAKMGVTGDDLDNYIRNCL